MVQVDCIDAGKFLVMSKLWQRLLKACDDNQDLTALTVSEAVSEACSSFEYSIGSDRQLCPTPPQFQGKLGSPDKLPC